MKNNTNTFLNKIGDVNSEIVSLTRKLHSIENLNKKLEDNLKEEASMRQNIEVKTFQINESFNNKFKTLSIGFEDLTTMMTTQVEQLRDKFMEETAIKNEEIYEEIQESFKRIENCEKHTQDLCSELTNFKSESNTRFLRFQDLITIEVNDLKIENHTKNVKLDLLDKKLKENLSLIQKDLTVVIKDVQILKKEIEIGKKFKEITLLNFKEISDDFVKNEENISKINNKCFLQLQEFNNKISHYEKTFDFQNDDLNSMKNDVSYLINNISLDIDNKFLKMNEMLTEKLNLHDKDEIFFQKSLINENKKINMSLNEVMKQNQKSINNMIEFMNEEIKLLQNKFSKLEEMMKNFRSEFLNNLADVEEFFTKKHEDLFRLNTFRN